MKQTTVRIIPCRCKDSLAPFELEELDSVKGYFRFSRHLSHIDRVEILRSNKYNVVNGA